MNSLLEVLDILVLLLLVVHVIRTVQNERLQGPGSPLLTIFVVLLVLIFATVSLSAYIGLVAASSSLARVIFLIVLLGMGALILSSTKRTV